MQQLDKPSTSVDGENAPVRSDAISCDICVIGAGSGGLSVASAAAMFGRSVVLVEKHKMGGDCLNYGCVPSKALIAAARRAHDMRTSSTFGIPPVEPQIDAKGVHAHVHRVIAAIAPNDSVERYTGMGVRVIRAVARFLDKRTVQAGDQRIVARRFVIATGSSPLVPSIAGLADVAHFTNETIFDQSQPMGHLIIIGGGTIGIELAQAFRRLGSNVTVLEGVTALGNEDPELAGPVLDRLRDEGIVIREGVKVERVGGKTGAITVTYAGGDRREDVTGTHLLVAAGRRPNTADLDLDKAGIKHGPNGIKVDAGLVTTNSRVFAIGDCVGGTPLTHVANYHAGIVVRRALFRLWSKVDPGIIPRVTFTDPELAYVGLTEEQARQKGHKVSVLRWPYHENDRAQAEGVAEGFIKVVVAKRGRIVGAGIVGAQAGELIQMWSLALSQRLKIRAMTDFISPYPTLSEISKRAALKTYATAPFNPLVRKVLDVLSKLG
jgi:pyruvate/2-oxoglutarate dehydrogenase complex dihydrolipoamide dehydrogenase (E3) component